jgi:hypothetical protein
MDEKRLIFTFYFLLFTLFYRCAVEDLQAMQAPVSGKQGILPALPCALHMESGIMDKRRLPAGDGSANFHGRFSLAVFLFRDFFQIRDF